MTFKPNSPEARDVAYHLHSFTNARVHEETGPLIIERGEGIYVYDNEGNEYIEGLAGLWSVAVGFNNERLINAATEQLKKLPFYHTFSSKAHPAVVALSEKLVQMTPDGLSKAYFCSSGSEANDTAIKFVWYYNNTKGRPEKKKFISRLDAYHGITIASGSLTGLPYCHADFDLPIFPVRHITPAHAYRFAEPGESEEEFSTRLADELEQVILEEGPETVAAFVGEPVMGAGGVMPPPSGYWEKVQKVCRKYDVLVIADEVICGFGRTGKMFACETYDIKPDILLLSKQLTSSYAPLSAVMISDELYQGIAAGTEKNGMLGMGFTASGHPVGTAIALENIAIIEDDGLVENARRSGKVMMDGLHRIAETHPLVGEARGVGLLGAAELVANKERGDMFDPRGKVGAWVAARGHAHGLVLRISRDSICFCPPLIITEEQVVEMLRRFELTLDDGYAWCKSEGLLKD